MNRKKILYYFLTFLICFSSVYSVQALCDEETKTRLTEEANKVKISYEIIENTTDEELAEKKYPSKDKIVVRIENLTKDLSIHLADDWGFEDALYAQFSLDVSYNDTTDGVYITEIVSGPIRHVKATISSSSDCGTKDEVLKEFVIPGYNYFYTLDVCKGSKAYYCQKYTSEEIYLSTDEVIERASQEKKEEAQTNEEKDFAEKYGDIFKVVFIVILIGVISGAILVVSNKRSKVK